MPNSDLFSWKGILFMFWNVSTSDKNAKYQYSNVQKYEICGQSVLKVYSSFLYCTQSSVYIGWSGPVIGSLLYAVIEFR